MPVISFSNFEGGLVLGLPPERLPIGTMRRLKGAHHNLAGRLRTRNGLSLISSLSIPHSLYRFNDARYVGDGTTVKKNGVNVITGLDGTRLAFVNMQRGLGVEDFLFVAGGGTLRKLTKANVETKWGIAAPSNVLAVTAGGTVNPLAAGVYKVAFTYLNNNTGQESNPSNIAEVELNGVDQSISIANPPNLPASADPQVTHIRIYVSVADGADLFHIPPDLSAPHGSGGPPSVIISGGSGEIQDLVNFDRPLLFDNADPKAYYDDAVGPHVGRCWWGRILNNGERGRVYFSPVGRPESVEGFLELAADDDEIQKLAIFGGQLFAFTQQAIYRIDGITDNFAFSRVPGSLGTVAPFSVCVTPIGILYVAPDGVRLFNGSASQLVGFNGLGILFRGESVDDHSAFEGLFGGYLHDEYFISDGSRTFAISAAGRWRECGFPALSFFYEHETDSLIIGHPNGKTFVAEAERVFDDDGEPISYDWQTPTIQSEDVSERFVQRVRLDADFRGGAVNVTAIEDGKPRGLCLLRGDNGRRFYDLSVNRSTSSFAVRLHGQCLRQVEVFSIDVFIR